MGGRPGDEGSRPRAASSSRTADPAQSLPRRTR